MSLFQKSVEKKYLNDLDSVLIDKKYANFQNYFGNSEIQKNIRNAKEEQFQEGFLRELFVNILGYTLNPEPNFNLTTELKNISNSKKADGAILKGDDATAVIELKGTNTTDLDKIETQAFGYKNHHPKCIYVITSNFGKLRFYIQNAVDHIDFDLFNLTKEQFSLLWLCLAKENLLNDLPLKIKDSSVLHEENITKKLYADYSRFRTAIYNNLIKNNHDTDKLLLFKKTQKLLDRFLFIFFAEDRLLVPPNSISQIIEKWKDDVDFGDAKPLYHTFKRYFHVLNVGRPKSGNRQEIFAYNGGLFKPDDTLDNIVIDDEILHEHTLKLSNYDFETDIDVNILGHIFEHSLGEIENVQAEIKGEKVDSQKTKRKKDGIFYTPKYITKYIVENTVGKLCEEKRAELKIVDEEYAKGRKNRKKDIVRTLNNKLDEYRNWLLALTILDPACGSGAFLNQALEFLINEHRKIDELRAQLLGGAIVFSDITTDILEKNIFGVDLNEESVEIAKLSLWLRTAQKGRKLNTLSNNIKCGNSLIDDPEIAGEKAFNWQKEFPNVFRKKEKKAWHVTWVTHDTRTSARMIKYKVRERRANGGMHVDRSVILNNNEAIKVTEIIASIITDEKFNCLAYNIGTDHVHMVLVCDEIELQNIVRKLKGKSAQRFKEFQNIPKDETYNLWAQKFDRKPIVSDKQLSNTIEYIQGNREKHQLPDINKGLQPLVKKMTCSHEHAFRTEYTGGFDVVIGNPPYVLCQPSNTKENILNYYKNFEVASYKIDLFHLFFEKSIHILKRKGKLGFITPNTYLTNKYIKPLRNFILSRTSISKVINHSEAVFAEASVDVATVILEKEVFKNHIIEVLQSNGSSFFVPIALKEQQSWIDDKDNIFNLKKEFEVKFNGCIPLIEICNSYFGIQAYDRKSSISTIKENGNYLPLIDGGDIFAYQYATPNKYFNFVEQNIKSGGDFNVYKDERIVIRQIGQVPIVGLCKGNILGSNTLYNINLNNDNYYLKYVLVVLNSKLIKNHWESMYSDSKQLFPKIKGYQLKSLPIKKAKFEVQKPFVEKADKIIELNNELQQKKSRFINRIKANLEIEKISNKIDKFYDYDFKTFLSELKKQKIKLSLSQQDEWEEYFNSYKSEINQLQSEIEKTDKEIDQMVYNLYGLTEEEIKIVEGIN